MQPTHSQERAMDLVRSLIEGTRAGKVRWEVGSSNTTFVFSRKAGTAAIGSRDGDGLAPYVFEIYDPNGVEVEGLTTASGETFGPVSEWTEQVPWNPLLAELYDVARSDALNIDSVVDALINAVETGDHSPPPADDDIPF